MHMHDHHVAYTGGMCCITHKHVGRVTKSGEFLWKSWDVFVEGTPRDPRYSAFDRIELYRELTMLCGADPAAARELLKEGADPALRGHDLHPFANATRPFVEIGPGEPLYRADRDVYQVRRGLEYGVDLGGLFAQHGLVAPGMLYLGPSGSIWDAGRGTGRGTGSLLEGLEETWGAMCGGDVVGDLPDVSDASSAEEEFESAVEPSSSSAEDASDSMDEAMETPFSSCAEGSSSGAEGSSAVEGGALPEAVRVEDRRVDEDSVPPQALSLQRRLDEDLRRVGEELGRMSLKRRRALGGGLGLQFPKEPLRTTTRTDPNLQGTSEENEDPEQQFDRKLDRLMEARISCLTAGRRFDEERWRDFEITFCLDSEDDEDENMDHDEDLDDAGLQRGESGKNPSSPCSSVLASPSSKAGKIKLNKEPANTSESPPARTTSQKKKPTAKKRPRTDFWSDDEDAPRALDGDRLNAQLTQLRRHLVVGDGDGRRSAERCFAKRIEKIFHEAKTQTAGGVVEGERAESSSRDQSQAQASSSSHQADRTSSEQASSSTSVPAPHGGKRRRAALRARQNIISKILDSPMDFRDLLRRTEEVRPELIPRNGGAVAVPGHPGRRILRRGFLLNQNRPAQVEAHSSP